MGQADDHVDLTFALTFQPCSRLSLALATRRLIKVSHTTEEKGGGEGSKDGRKDGMSPYSRRRDKSTLSAIFAPLIILLDKYCKGGTSVRDKHRLCNPTNTHAQKPHTRTNTHPKLSEPERSLSCGKSVSSAAIQHIPNRKRVGAKKRRGTEKTRAATHFSQ